MNYDDFRRRADRVRDIPLETVLAWCRAVRDRRDQRKWHTERGPISITGQKFTAWQQGQGGGGAIDLVMLLFGLDARAAVQWLEQYAPPSSAPLHMVVTDGACRPVTGLSLPQPRPAGTLRLPVRDDSRLQRVRDYLTRQRVLSPGVVDSLVEAGRVYADARANAVFLLVAGKQNRPVGAELRGTGSRLWRGLAPGTRKDRGYFWVGVRGQKRVVLCESAIDAISCHMLHPDRVCLSTAGARAKPSWLTALLVAGCEVECGYDADDAGDTAAQEMLRLYPCIERLRPTAKDWNDTLRALH